MLAEIQQTHDDARWLRWSSWIVLLAGLTLSLAAWWRSSDNIQRDADERFARSAANVQQQVERQLDHYVDVLQSFRAMYLLTEHVPRAVFHRHFKQIDVTGEYPSMLAVQFARRVPHEHKQAFEAAVRADRSVDPQGYPNYSIRPEGDRPEYVAVEMNEPMAPNAQAMGFDMAAPGVRLVVLEKARDTGEPQLSAPIELVQAPPPDRTGLLVRLPVYRPGASLDSVQARRDAFVGLISGVIKASGFMAEAGALAARRSVQWRVMDVTPGHARDEAAAVFDSLPAPVGATARAPRAAEASDTLMRPMNAHGRQWQLHFTRSPVNARTAPYPMALLLGGLFSTLGLWWAMRSAASRQSGAAAMAIDLSVQAHENEHRLHAVLDNMADGLVTMTPRGTILSVNRAVCRMFGHAEEDLVDAHISRLLPDAMGADGPKAMDVFLAGQRIGLDGVGHRSQGRRANGMRFPIDLAMSSVHIDGQMQHIGLMRDLSKLDAAERAIVEAHRQLNEVDEMRRVIIHNAPYAIFVLNPQGIIQNVNPAGEKLVGYSAKELVGRCTTQRFFDADQVADRARMLALRLNQPVQELDVLKHLSIESPGLPSEWNMRRADGSYLVGEITVTELRSECGQLNGYLVMAYDVTSRRDAEHQLQHMAQHDALTALPNRNMLQEHLKTCMTLADRYGHHMAMMFLDLDRFKKINDGLGHQVGDAVLIEVARRLRTSMRTSDIVARLGGDEFVVLLPQITAQEDGELVAQKVLDLFAEPICIHEHELRVTPSIGLALYPEHGGDTITLMRHADLAMYQAKSNGRNRVQVYSDQMASPTVETLVLENDLYKCLERDELRLHFQPQYDCASGHITGAEALLRWEHGGRLVPPSDFIPTAEETGLIVPMGEWVLRRACTLAQQWRERSGWPLRVAVNLSAVQLDQQDIPALVAQVLKETGLPATALELEITESVVVRESLRAADILTQLRAQGVSIAIDDFGVGYSSFAYLRELPVDRLKLDRSFLSSVPNSPGDSRLVAALIAMGHRLDVGIVAEGVETHEQAAFLVAHGCDEAQGYHLGRPMKEDVFEALLMEHSREHADQIAAIRQDAAASTATAAAGKPSSLHA